MMELAAGMGTARRHGKESKRERVMGEVEGRSVLS